MNDPISAARAATGDYESARDVHAQLHRDLYERHEEMGPHGVDEHEAAMKLLEADHPRLKSVRARYERNARTEYEREQRAGGPPRPPASGRPTRPRRGARQRPAARRRSFGYGFLTGRSHPLAESTGLPGGARSASSLVMAGLGGVIGLSIVYDVLVSSEKGGRRSAPVLFLQGIAGLLGRIVAPVDPLGPAPGTGPNTGDFAPGATSAGGGGDFSAAQLHKSRLTAAAPGRSRTIKAPGKTQALPRGPLPDLTTQLLTGVNG